MKYFLQNIAQGSPMRTIMLVLIGLAFWALSLVHEADILATSATLVLTLINALLLAQMYDNLGITKLFSPFVATSYWLAMSAIPILHTCWQVQTITLAATVTITMMVKAKYKDNVTEEAFLSTLVCCFALPTRVIMLACIGALWAYLIVRGLITWRVMAASLLAIALRVVLMVILHYFGWMEWLWVENIPHLSWMEWVLAGGVLAEVLMMTLCPIQKPSVSSGCTYLICLLGTLAIGGWIVVERTIN